MVRMPLSAVRQHKVSPSATPEIKSQTKIINHDIIPSAASTKRDNVSLLDELPPEVPSQSRINARLHEADDIIKRLSFKIKPEHGNRLRTVVQLRLKDVRSEEQTKEIGLRSEINGGLGLADNQINEVLVACHSSARSTKNISADVAPLKAKPQTLPAIKQSDLPSVATPHNAFVHEALAPVNKLAPLPEQSFKLAPATNRRPPVQDIVPHPHALETNPTEEIAAVTLIDFRRLSGNPIEAADRLRQKLLNLKEESVLLYIDAVAAWHRSELYADYLKFITERIATKTDLNALAPKENIQPTEIRALATMNSSL